MKKQFSLLTLLLLFTIGIGQMWAESVTFTATDMSGKTSGVKKESHITALCPTSESDQQAYKTGSAVKHKAISLGSSADTAVIVPASGKSLHFRADAGYKITGISIFAAANKDSICGEPIVMWTGTISKKPAYVGNIEAPARNGSSDPAPIVVAGIPEGTTAFALYRRIKYNSSTGEIGSGSNFGRSQQTWNIFSVTITYEATGSDPVCPETLTISSKDSKTAFDEGDAIELTAALAKGNGDISYQWYKGSVAPANAISGATKAKYEVASCTTADAGDYFCVASKTSCSDAVNASAFAITVAAAPVIEPTGTATITYALSGSTATGTVSGVSSISGLSTSLTLSTLTLSGTQDGYSGAIKGCTSTTELVEADYVDVQFTVASGYVFTPSAVSVKVNPFNATGAVKAVVALQDAALDVRSEVLACAKSTDNAVVFADGAFTGKEFEGTVHVRIYFYGPTSSKAFYIKSPIEITGAVAVAPTKYDLEFAANGGEGTMSTLKYKSGVEVTLPACTFDAPSSSQEFDAWVVTKKVGGASVTVTDGKFTMPTEAVVATATWKTKDVKYTVTYKEGEATIGTEEVIVGGHPAEYAAKQSKNLATFVDWYSDADLADGHLISDIAAMTVSEDVSVYGKWTYTYAQSVNIEKWVLDNSKTPNSDKTGALRSLLGARGFASNLAYEEKKVELDSLNDDKGTGRNYAYLGLKVKSGGKMLDFRLAKDNTVKVKFGNVGTTPLYAINGGEYSNMPIEEKVFTYTATGNDYISIKTADDNAVVFQQIMIGEDIQDVTLPEPTRHAVVLSKAGETEHGTLSVASPETYNWLAKDVEVTLTVAADEGYYIESVTLNGEALTPSENVYSFAMPNAKANVVATFAEIVPNNVTYKPNGAEGPEYIVDYDATVVLGCPAQFTAPANTKFDGWNTEPDGTGDAYAEGDPVLSALQLYAQWKEYFVITYMDGDDVLDTEDVFVGEAPVGIADPVKAMNIFQGWTLAGSDEVIDVTTLDAATTVYAKWEAIDACFYFSAKSVDESTAIAVDEEIENTYGGKVIAKTSSISYGTLGVLVASSGSTYMKVELDYAMIEGTKISVKLAAAGTSTRGVNICYDANKDHKAVPMTWSATEAGEVKEFEYTLDSESALNGKKEFFIYRAANTYIQTITVKDCAPQDYTVTYKDGETVLGTEQVFENAHPTANGINTHKKGYEFQGWAETVDGAVVDLDDITITAAKNLFAQYTVKDCSTMGVKFTMVPNANTLSSDYQLTGTTEQSIGEYATVTGGVVYLNNNNSSNRVKITKTTSTIQLVSGDEGYIHVELDCPLKENDSIKFDNSERLVLAHNASKTSSVNIAKADHFYIVPASWEGKYDFYIWRTGTGCTISGIEVVRPEIYTVSFNMMGHGSAIAPMDVVKGAKITAPTAPEDDDYAFAGWYKENTLSNEWKFDVDVVSKATTLYAKWIDLSDATLKSLKYGANDIELQDGVYEYNVELPALTTAVPALTAVTCNPNASAVVADAAAFDESGNAQSTVTVTPQKEGAATQTYTVNFSKAASVALQDVTGSITWNFANAVTANVSITGTPQVLANYAGVTNDNTFESDKLEASGEKFTAGSNANLRANYIRFHTTVPGRLSISYSNTGGSNPARYIYVNGVKYDEEGSASTTKKGLDTKVFIPAGDVELEMKDGEAASKNVQIYQMIFDATPDYTRTVTSNIGTLCVDHNVPAGQYFGATFYQIASRNEQYNDKIDFEEVLPNEELKAGEPYIFQSNTGKIELFYGATIADAPVAVRGMHGWFSNTEESTMLDITEENKSDILYIAQNKLWNCEDLVTSDLEVVNNRAYIVMSEVPTYAEYQEALQQQQNSAPRRRIVMGAQGEQVATGFENLNASEKPMKLMINGQIFILRGEKMYDVTGKVVK